MGSDWSHEKALSMWLWLRCTHRKDYVMLMFFRRGWGLTNSQTYNWRVIHLALWRFTMACCHLPWRSVCGAVRNAASSYAVMCMVAGSRPVLVIAWEWHIGLALLFSCSGALEYPTTNSSGPINKSLSLIQVCGMMSDGVSHLISWGYAAQITPCHSSAILQAEICHPIPGIFCR